MSEVATKRPRTPLEINRRIASGRGESVVAFYWRMRGFDRRKYSNALERDPWWTVNRYDGRYEDAHDCVLSSDDSVLRKRIRAAHNFLHRLADRPRWDPKYRVPTWICAAFDAIGRSKCRAAFWKQRGF